MMVEYIVMVDEKRKVGDPKIDPLAYLYSLPVLEEIIRCRDCKHFDDEPNLTTSDGTKWHTCRHFECDILIEDSEQPNGFCAWAERDE